MPARSLRQGLDNEVYTIVDRLRADQSIPADVRSIYQAIQRSNSSLKRKPRKIIEDSIQRVLEVVAENDDDEEAALDQQHETTSPTDANVMNRAITSSWNVSTPPIRTAAMTNGQRIPPITANTTPPTSRKSDNDTGEPPKKRRRAAPSDEKDRSPPTDVGWDDLGGVDHVIAQLEDIIALPFIRPQWYANFSVPIPRGVLLHGPPGCGKSILAKACAAEIGVPFIEILGPSIVSGMSGESEKQVREIFDEARRLAPCLIFIDEIDVIAPKRESSQSQMEKRIVAQLLISMDSLAMETKGGTGKPVIVLAATNRPDSLDPALRRGGRFDTEINMGVPNQATREHILRAQTRQTPLAPDVDFAELAKKTPGFVGADLRDLVGKAGAYTMKKFKDALIEDATPTQSPTQTPIDTQLLTAPEKMDVDRASIPKSKAIRSFRDLIRRGKNEAEPSNIDISSGIDMAAFLAVLPAIVPSSKREGFATIPDVSWDDIGALESVRESLRLNIVEQIKNPKSFEKFDIVKPTGILLWGPPGCGKTLLAKAVAAESKANFISVKGPELLEKYVGESERAVRTLFMRARSSVPCVIFFDELDALVPRRDSQNSEASVRVVNTILTELDGLSDRQGIWVIAATNRPDMIDEAMLRPGRIETPLYVGLPGADERVEIMKTLLKSNKHVVWPAGVEDMVRSERCEGYSGADLEALKRKAGLHAYRRGGVTIEMSDFEATVGGIKASVGGMQRYEAFKKRFGESA